jgi:large subunit ribosomal protein L15
MKLHELRGASAARKARKRVGRGTGSGHGKTSGRGQKGQGARTSVNIPNNFEGGQTRLAMRMPKLRGFKNRNKVRWTVVNLTRLGRFKAGTVVTPEALVEAGVIKDPGDGIKVLGAGKLRHALTVHAHQFSGSAEKKILAAGGQARRIGEEVPAGAPNA